MPENHLQTLANLYKQGKYKQLLRQADAVITANPQEALVHNILGATYAALGQADKGIASYRAALALKPDFVDALCNLGALLDSLKRSDEAINSYQQALAIKPHHAAAHNNLGSALFNLGRFSEAIVSYHAALKWQPDYADAHVNMASALRAQGQLEAAVNSYEKALIIRPAEVAWHFKLGIIQQALGRLEAAIKAYKNTLQLQPKHAEAYYNLGLVVKLQGNNEAAYRCLSKALQLKPNYVLAHYSLGNTLNSLGKYQEAIASYKNAIRLAPDYDAAQSKKYYLQAHICDWKTMAQDNVDALVKLKQLGVRGLVSPFDMLSLDDNTERHLKRAQIFADKAYAYKPLPMDDHKPIKKIRIAYFSADFHNHATMYLMARMFELHDRAKFEIHAFSFGPDKDDDMRRRLKTSVDGFYDVRRNSDKDIALMARKLGIDIAVDLKGYTEGARMGIFAYRAAPLQVSYLGHPGTTGARFMDYVVADRVVIPPKDKRHYSEKVVYLPHCYQVNDNRREIATKTPSREALGLPDNAFVFCCFNNNYKISVAEFDIWMRLLQQVKGSVLWLFKANEWAEKNLKAAAVERGVDASRLVFAPRVPQAEHLARQRQADLFLDTFNYNAHTTASDALWAGLPVLTKFGESFSARVAASLLTAINLPELITNSEADYEALALALAQSPKRLQALKEKLWEQRETTALFDAEQFTRDIEQAYSKMFRLHTSSKPPKAISV